MILAAKAILMRPALLALAMWLAAPTGALAYLQISPLRQVITAEAPEATIRVSNPSGRIVDGRLSWVELTAEETGYGEADISQRRRIGAAPYLIAAPAQFRLAPGAHLQIIIRLKEGVELPVGERRSHLLIETGASRTPLRKASDNGLQVDIAMGVSTPVILRNGGRAAAKIGETRLLRDNDGQLVVSTLIEPKGDISAYGRLSAIFKPAGGDQKTLVLGVRNNVAGYLDAPARRIEIPLGFDSLGAGELTLRFDGAAEFEGRVFDERTFDIAPPADR